MAEELEEVGDERLVRETEKLFEYLEEEESKKKRTKASKRAERVSRAPRLASQQQRRRLYQKAGEEVPWRWIREIVCRRL